MYYIFVVNDVKKDHYRIEAEKIVDYLLNKKIWIFQDTYPLNRQIKKLKRSDKVIIYLAGQKRMFFLGSFEIDGDIEQINFSASNEFEKNLLTGFKF